VRILTLLRCFTTEAFHGAASIQEHQVPLFCSRKLMLYTAIHHIYTFHKSVYIYINIYLVYIILIYISSNKKSSKAPLKLK